MKLQWSCQLRLQTSEVWRCTPQSLMWTLAGDLSSQSHGPLHGLPQCPHAIAGFPQLMMGERGVQDRSCYLYKLISDTITLLYFIGCSDLTLVQCESRLKKGVDTRKWRSLETISEVVFEAKRSMCLSVWSQKDKDSGLLCHLVCKKHYMSAIINTQLNWTEWEFWNISNSSTYQLFQLTFILCSCYSFPSDFRFLSCLFTTAHSFLDTHFYK